MPRLATEYSLYRFRAINHLSWTQVHFLLIIDDRVCYLTLIGKHALLVPSRVHYCDDSCFATCLFADFIQCPCVPLLQRSCCRELNCKMESIKQAKGNGCSQYKSAGAIFSSILSTCPSIFSQGIPRHVLHS